MLRDLSIYAVRDRLFLMAIFKSIKEARDFIKKDPKGKSWVRLDNGLGFEVKSKSADVLITNQEQNSGESEVLSEVELKKLIGFSRFNSHNRKIVAVDQVSFNIKKGECFTLLGVNGAGKTTTFKMLSGEIKPTLGEAYINKISICNNLTEARKYIGYCG